VAYDVDVVTTVVWGMTWCLWA